MLTISCKSYNGHHLSLVCRDANTVYMILVLSTKYSWEKESKAITKITTIHPVENISVMIIHAIIIDIFHLES